MDASPCRATRVAGGKPPAALTSPTFAHPRYAGLALNSAFVSDLTPLVKKADLWIHGHVHDSFDYEVLETRTVANPRGYALNRLSAENPIQLIWENPRFKAQRIVDAKHTAKPDYALAGFPSTAGSIP